MSSVPPDVLDAVRELLQVDRELRVIRAQQKELEARRTEQRERILAHYRDNARFKTPLGDVVVRTREIPSRFTLEDIRDILTEAEFLSDESRGHLTHLFEEEAENKLRTTRTLSVRRPQTRKRRQRHRNKTAKNTHNESGETIIKED